MCVREKGDKQTNREKKNEVREQAKDRTVKRIKCTKAKRKRGGRKVIWESYFVAKISSCTWHTEQQASVAKGSRIRSLFTVSEYLSISGKYVPLCLDWQPRSHRFRRRKLVDCNCHKISAPFTLIPTSPSIKHPDSQGKTDTPVESRRLKIIVWQRLRCQPPPGHVTTISRRRRSAWKKQAP